MPNGPISHESKALIALIRSFGIPHRITAINDPGHSRDGWHYADGTAGEGTAIDFAGPIPYWHSPVSSGAIMLQICERLEPHYGDIAELICSHLDFSIVHGEKKSRRAVKSHWNHGHLAVRPGVFLAPVEEPMEVTVVPDNPDLPNIEGPLTFHPVINTNTGECRGYYIFSTATGELHAWGEGAPYMGRSEDITPGS